MTMPSDIRLQGDAVIVEGELLVGTTSGARPVQVESGEIHAGGPAGGYSFADRAVGSFRNNPANGERWVLYAQGGQARLWSGVDAVNVVRKPGSSEFSLGTNGDVLATGAVRGATLQATGACTSGEVSTATVKATGAISAGSVAAGSAKVAGVVEAGSLVVNGTINAARFGFGAALELQDPRAPTTKLVPIETDLRPATPAAAKQSGGSESPGPRDPGLQQVAIPPRVALFHDFGPGRDRLVVNQSERYAGGVVVDSDLTVVGSITEASSITLKEDVRALDHENALAALDELHAVSFRYCADEPGTQHLGFIAEHVPDLVAQPGRDRLRPMDLIAVLTTVVQVQQRALSRLTDAVAELRGTPS
jgi:hypothetical protein